MIALVDHENIGDLHNAGLDGLNIVPHSGDKNDNRDIGDADDVNLILTDAYSLNHDDIAARRVEYHRDVSRAARKSAQRSACGHAADVNARIRKMLLHANTIAENRSPGVRAGGIHGN